MSTPLRTLSDRQLAEFERLLGRAGDPAADITLDQLAQGMGVLPQGAGTDLTAQEWAAKLAAESSYAEFVRQAWPVVEPDVDFIPGRHIDGIAKHLEALVWGDPRVPNLLLNIPPGAMKSLLCSVFLCPWAWVHQPSLRFFYASYEAGLSTRDSMKCRQILQSAWYQRLWGGRFKLTGDQNEKTRYENDKWGWRMSTSVGGRGTGEHPDIIICFPAGTPVTTDSGRVPIEQLHPSEHRVLTVGDGLGRYTGRFRLTARTYRGNLVRVRMRSGRIVECTPNHQFFVTGKGWTAAERLRPGDGIPSDDLHLRDLRPAIRANTGPRKTRAALLQQEVPRPSNTRQGPSIVCWPEAPVRDLWPGDFVEQIQPGPWCETVYCLTVPGTANFFAHGLLAHNCDDPLKAQDAESANERRAVIDWWDGTISSRGKVRGARRGVVMQRLHQEDLSGHILETINSGEEGRWVHICLPMRAETDRMRATPLGWSDWRKPGQLLWPAAFDETRVRELEAELGTLRAAGQLQQRPVPLGGQIFHEDWFEIVDAAPAKMQRVRYWDAAGTEGGGAYTAGVRMGLDQHGTIYVEDVRRAQVSAQGRLQLQKMTARQDSEDTGNMLEVWAEQEPGSSGKDVAAIFIRQLRGFPVYVQRPTGDKVTRAMPFAAYCEAGNVKLVRGPWNRAYIDELMSFPTGKWKDQVDGSSGAFNRLMAHSGRGLLVDELIASGDPEHAEEEHRPFSQAEVAELPDFLRDLITETRRTAEERDQDEAW